MPSMPRIKGLGRKVAYKLLGVPANIAFKPSKVEKVVNRRLNFEETYRVR
jgi:hypothetical protein